MNHHSNNNELAQSVMAIIGILALVAIIEASLLAMMAGGVGSNQISDIEDSTIIDARVKPAVTLADIRGGSNQTMATAPIAAKKSGKELYQATCMACHDNGVAGAPKPGDKAAWEPRFANGIDALLSTAINGRGAMPARGGSAYSDAELTQIIKYMLIKSDLMSAEAEKAPAPMAAPQAAMTTNTQSEKTANTIDLVAGEKAYRGACFACHDTGAAGAPKLGDASAWASRQATGMASLMNSALHGKGAMPPKGGATYLSDGDIKNIVGFMLNQF